MFKLTHLSSFFSKVFIDTIYAVATNHSKPSPINIVRISGPDSYKCLSLISNNSLSPQSPKESFITTYKILPRYAHNATLYSHHQKSPIDKCLIMYFPEGKSYNGEDIFELHLHGSPAVLKLTMLELKRLGFRLAEPGQFTKRAFMNNKMNLIEVEGLNELIHSENQFSRRIAMCHVLGETAGFLEKIKKELVHCLAACEAFIDFQEDELDVKADLFDKTKLRAIKVVQQIKLILSRRKQIETLSNGINLVIVGKPNAGKSTIMNKMVKEEVAIVSDEPGTTRDIIRTSFQYKGMQFNLSDTAGIRETEQKVQKEGIRRALEKVKISHMNLLIVDGNEEQIVEKERELEIVMKDFGNQELFMSKKTIVILNKTDLLDKKIKDKKLFINSNGQIRPIDLSISALHSNIQQILEHLLSKCKQIYNIQQHQDQIFLTRQRHFQCLEQCLFHLLQYLSCKKVDIASEELRLAIQEIGKILGRVDCEDVLDVLFKDFCIGK